MDASKSFQEGDCPKLRNFSDFAHRAFRGRRRSQTAAHLLKTWLQTCRNNRSSTPSSWNLEASPSVGAWKLPSRRRESWRGEPSATHEWREDASTVPLRIQSFLPYGCSYADYLYFVWDRKSLHRTSFRFISKRQAHVALATSICSLMEAQAPFS